MSKSQQNIESEAERIFDQHKKGTNQCWSKLPEGMKEHYRKIAEINKDLEESGMNYIRSPTKK